MNYQELLHSVADYIKHFFRDHYDARLVYHNESHTKGVVKAASRIGNHYQLDDRSYFIVMTAAWFHDIGYLMGPGKEHEVKGAELAAEYLATQGVDEEAIAAVKGCILATQMPQHPVGLLEEIVCDADLFHLGTDDMKEKSKLIRKEFSAMQGVELDKETWRRGTIQLMETHHYFTDYCQLLLNKKKEENLESLKAKEAEKEAEAALVKTEAEAIVPVTIASAIQPVEELMEKKAGKNKKEKDDRPDKGIETMFRVASSNHQRLSDMADSKAHIMISVNSIVISVVLSVLLRKLDDNPGLVIPTFTLLTVNVTTIVFSILATRPKIPDGVFTAADVANKSVNLLFFGNFYKTTYADYEKGMHAVMNDREYLYNSLIKDIYSQGVVLGKKYKLLRISYNVFMFGLVISVIAFAVASIFTAIHR